MESGGWSVGLVNCKVVILPLNEAVNPPFLGSHRAVIGNKNVLTDLPS